MRRSLQNYFVLKAASQFLAWQNDRIEENRLGCDRTAVTEDGRRWVDFAFLVEQRQVLDFGEGLVGIGINGRSFHSRPFSDLAVPADDAVNHQGVVLDHGVVQDDRFPDANAGRDHHALPDANVRSQHGGIGDLRRRMDEHGAVDDCAVELVREPLRMVFPLQFQRLPVRVNRRRGVLHLRPLHVQSQCEDFPCAGQRRQNLLLELDVSLILPVAIAVLVLRPRVEHSRDLREDVGADDVNSAVDEGRHVAAGLLHIMRHLPGGLAGHQTAVIHAFNTVSFGAENGNLKGI